MCIVSAAVQLETALRSSDLISKLHIVATSVTFKK
jgi:hypothetical protein